MEDILSSSEICARCEITREALRQWRDLGMPYRAVSPKVYIYRASEALAWLDDRLPERAALWRAHERGQGVAR